MKTPIQELIEQLKELAQLINDDDHIQYRMYRGGLREAIEKAESTLEKEKALLIKTHGHKKVYDSQIDPTIVTGEEWYAKTFNTKER